MKLILIALFIGITAVMAQKDVSVTFNLSADDAQSSEIQIDVLKFYVSSVSFRFDDDSAFYEANSYHLINIEDSNSQQFIISDVPNKSISKIVFTLGTDSLANVSGALDGDLDPILGMYWAWNSGYINFKLEGNKGNQPFEFHLGGYNGIQATAKTFSFDVNSRNAIIVNVNPNEFINHIDLTANHSVMIPGALAVSLTDFYQYMLSVE